MLLLAQDLLADAAEPGRLLGLTVDEWTRLLPVLGAAIGSVVVAVIVAIKRGKETAHEKKKVKALSNTLEEHSHDYPGQASRLKGRALHEANKAGVQEGEHGMGAEAAKAKARRATRVNGGGAALSLLLLVALLGGCAVGHKAEALIETECRAHDRDLEEWDSLTPAQRKGSYEDSRAGVYGIRYAVLGVPLPVDLESRHEADKALEAGQ